MVKRYQKRGCGGARGGLSGKPLWSRLSSPGDEQRGKSVVLELELVVLQESEDCLTLTLHVFPLKEWLW